MVTSVPLLRPAAKASPVGHVHALLPEVGRDPGGGRLARDPRPGDPSGAILGTDAPALTLTSRIALVCRACTPATNPFRYARPVGHRRPHRPRRRDRAAPGHGPREQPLPSRRAPRRYGKTSLLRRVLGEAGAEGWTGVYVDFFGVLTLTDVADRIERAYTESLTGRAARWFDGVRAGLKPTVSAGAGPVRASAQLTPIRHSLAERLDLPVRVARQARHPGARRLRRVPGGRSSRIVPPTRSSAPRSSTTARPPATSSRGRTSA